MKSVTLKSDPFLLGTIAFWIVATAIVFTFSKADIHLYLNNLHNSFFDVFFKYTTFLGDGLFIVIAALALAFFRLRYGVFILAGYLGSGIFVQLLKRLFFSEVQRPKAFFEGVADLYFVPGVDVHTAKSFPSGHTTSAFAFFACLALLNQSKTAKLFFFVLAFLTGYSRIYLSQHFLVDVLVGSALGTLSTYFLTSLFIPDKTKWMEYSLKKTLFR